MRKRFFIIFFLLAIFLFAPVAVEAATLFLSPASTSQTVGDSFNVSVRVNSSGADINTAQATISFPSNLLEVTGVSQAGIFNLWPVTPTYSNASGTITFAGGVPGGYTGSSGTIILITFNAKAVGTAMVSVGSASVLANDGLGTDLLTSQSGGSYAIAAPGEEEEPEPEPEPEPELDLPRAPAISSSTHPEQSLWYANSDPIFKWSREVGVTGFSFVFDDKKNTTPDTVQEGTDIEQDYTGTNDGIWCFHVRARNGDGWGAAGHYCVQIDTTSPLPFDIKFLDGKRTSNPTPRLSFEATDETSGIHHYNLITDGGDPVGINAGETTPYTMPELDEGEHNVTAIAYDYAGNTTGASGSFTVISPTALPPIVLEEEEGEKSLAEKISETFDEMMPKPIRDISNIVSETFDKLKESKAVSDVVNNVVEPLVTTTAVIAATSLAATVATTVNFYNLLYLFFRFGYFWLIPITLGKKRKGWGVVFDSITGKPVPRAVVRIFTREFNKLKESQITDAQGRFGFLIEKGKYYITASAPGYIFPSHILKTASISQYDDIYRGDTVEIEEETGGVLSMNIPIDPNMKEVSQTRLTWLKVLSIVGYFLEKISMPLLIAGTALSWISLIIEPRWSNYFILSLYGLLIILRYIVTKKFGRSVGLVKDKQTNEPVEMAIVRIFNADSSMLVATRVTNKRGQFNTLLAPGKYYLVIIKPGYENFQSRPVVVSKYRGYIHFTAELEPKRTGSSPLIPEQAEGKDVEIHLEDESVPAADKGAATKPVQPIKQPPPTTGKGGKAQKSSDLPPAVRKAKKGKPKPTNKQDKGAPPDEENSDTPSLPGDLGSLSNPDKDT